MRFQRTVMCAVLATGLCSVAALAQGRGGAPAATNDFYRFIYTAPETAHNPLWDEPPVETHHQITVDGQTINYTAHVGFMPIKNATSQAVEGHLFYIYYSKDGVSDETKRPLWFLFNGGPGAATIWLHMGAFGPKKVKLSDEGLAPQPPYTYVDNPNTLLDTGDLVFIDAMGTGFSRPERPEYGPDFGGVDNDLAAFGEFIRSFLGQYNRWGSPRFVGGESYGTTRAAGLAGYLTDHDMPVNGIMLLSATIATDANAGEQRNLSTTPTEIMTAWYHHRVAPEYQKLTLDQMADKAREFSSGEYLEALTDGARMPAAQHAKVVADFSALTGMPVPYVEANNLRVSLGAFSTELLRDQHMMTSRLDSRFAGYLDDGASDNTSFDFSNANIEDSFLSAFEQYINTDLNYHDNDLYYVAGNQPPWGGAYNTVTNLEDGFAKNPHQRLFVGMGYFDFACPFYPVEWTIAHLKVSDDIREHGIETGHYASGHMVYVDLKAATQFHADLAKFVKDSVPQ